MRLQILIVAAVAILVWKSAAAVAQEQSQILCTSPSGKLRVENRAKEGADVWVVSTNDPAQQAKLPIETPQFIMGQCHFSPNEEWIFVLWKNPMFLTGELFHRKGALEIERFDSGQSFNQIAWAEATRLGAVKRNYAAEGLDPQMSFGCWSMDSSRLLMKLEGEVQQLVPPFGYVYANTRTKQFELTNYLRKINKGQTAALVCAEPVHSLPSQPELKARFDTLDRELNTTYPAVLTKAENKRLIPDAQRTWIKHRDQGAKIYLSLFPQSERESRRLQFLCDVTAVRIAMPPNEWEFQP
jgi:uncharacterized protein YecT (DUF1311 family)